MTYLIIILILLIIALILMELGKIGKVVVYRSERQKQKQENKNKILELFKDKKKITNNDVEELLNVSDATAERYLNELEKEGRAKQIGKTGKSVYYELA